jgi:DNA-binding beta-propeller fold protein YncE
MMAADRATLSGISAAQSTTQSSVGLRFIREFSRAEDVTRELHPILDRSLDIIAGPAESHPHEDKLVAPQSVVTDSRHRVFVADPKAGVVHVFDLTESKYSALQDHGHPMRSPYSLAIDREDNVYVTDVGLAAVLAFDAKGKFLRYLGKTEEDETYFQAPVAIAIHPSNGRIYVCDSRRHMILILDKKSRIVGHIGKRWGGKQPGEFRYPSRMVIAGDELFVLDSGNSRLQVLDLGGRFRREVPLPQADLEDGLAVDREGNIYVGDTQLNAIEVLDRGGQLLYKFGQPGAKGGEFSKPSGLWIESGNQLYVADTGNQRVQLLQIGEKH